MKEPKNALVLSVKLENGHFETTLRVPFPCTVDEGKAAMEQWFDLAMTGLRIGATDIVASLGDSKKDTPDGNEITDEMVAEAQQEADQVEKKN